MSSVSHLNLNLKALCTEGRLKEALRILLTIHNTPVESSTYLHLLHACTAHKTLSEGKQIHSHINGRGLIFATNTFLQNRLINMYDKCGSLVDAREVFDHITEPDVFSWNMIIAAYQRHEHPQQAFELFHQMQRTPVQPDHFTFSTILPVCTSTRSLKHGLQIHGKIIRCGFQFDVIVMNTLIDMYAKYGTIQKARELFDKMPLPDVVSFIAVIAGYAQIGLVENALETFQQMQLAGIKPNSATFASIISTCAKMQALKHGMEIHQKVIENRFLLNVVVVTALIDMYAKCGSIQKAQELFVKMPQRDVALWNVMIAGYTQNGLFDKALDILMEIQVTGVKPNSITFASFLPACAQIGALEQGMEIHQKIIKNGFLSHVIVANALLDMYAKCGNMRKATELFHTIHQRDLASWNVIILGYAQNGFVDTALKFFKQMQLACVKPNSATFASILPACATLGALEQGMQIHQEIIKSGFLLDVVVVTALIDIYAKCGNILEAHGLFEKMPQRDVASWNAMIVGYTQHGLADKALEMFKQLQLRGVKPDSLTFASILPACAKLGALEQGMEIHQKIIKSGFLSDAVANSLIDMYAKCGSIQKAHELFDRMPQKNVVSWTAMIAGYAMHGYSKDALKIFELMHSGTNPNHVSFLCVLSACSHAGLVNDGCKYFNSMGGSYCIMPSLDHYVCMVDLLGRAGYLEETLNFIIKLPIKPDVGVWMCLLGACRSHKNIGVGEYVATLLFELDPKNAAPFVLWSNINAEEGRWGVVHKVRKLMNDRGVKKIPGCSWIEVRKMVHAFCVEDISHPQTPEIHAKMEELS